MSKNKLVDFRAVREAVSMERILEHYGLLEPSEKASPSLLAGKSSGPWPAASEQGHWACRAMRRR